MIVVPDRTHGQTARAVAERSDHPQQALPEAEQLARPKRAAFVVGIGGHEFFEIGQDREKAELLGFLGAIAFVDVEVADGIGRAGMEAAAAQFADTDLLAHRLVGLDFGLGQDAGEIEPRPELGRQDVDFEPERPQARLDPQMAGRQATVTRALVGPIGLLGCGHERGGALAFEPVGEAIGDAVHFAQDQHVEILDRDVRFATERADRNPLHDHDDALAMRRNPLRGLRPARVGRKRVQNSRRRDADQIGAELPGFGLDGSGVEGRHDGYPSRSSRCA